MSLFNHWSTTTKRITFSATALVLAVVLGAFLTGYGNIADAAGSKPAAASGTPGQGENGFGMTHAFYQGKSVAFTYSHGYWCDTAVPAASTTKCEVGAKWQNAPSKNHDPLFITVPLGFKPKKMIDCPSNLTCIDHPATVDMSRLEPALKPLFPQYTDAQLTAALQNYTTPGHDHFITTKDGGRREWWDVRVVAVTNAKVYQKIQKEKSYSYIRSLIRHKNKAVLGPIPSNIFLFFSVQK